MSQCDDEIPNCERSLSELHELQWVAQDTLLFGRPGESGILLTRPGVKVPPVPKGAGDTTSGRYHFQGRVMELRANGSLDVEYEGKKVSVKREKREGAWGHYNIERHLIRIAFGSDFALLQMEDGDAKLARRQINIPANFVGTWNSSPVAGFDHGPKSIIATADELKVVFDDDKTNRFEFLAPNRLERNASERGTGSSGEYDLYPLRAGGWLLYSQSAKTLHVLYRDDRPAWSLSSKEITRQLDSVCKSLPVTSAENPMLPVRVRADELYNKGQLADLVYDALLVISRLNGESLKVVLPEVWQTLGIEEPASCGSLHKLAAAAAVP